MKYYSTYHPVPLFTYFISIIVISMFITNPVMIALSLVGGVIFIATITTFKCFIKDMMFYVPFFILIALTNPLFSHNGVTPLFFLNGNAITLEAILYGVDMAAMIVAVIYWCKCYSIIVDSEKFIYLFGKAIPKLSLVLSMALKFIPMFKRQHKKIKQAQTTLGYYTNDSYFDRIKNSLRIYSCLITWSLEMSQETALSMKMKGYGLKGRTHFNNYKFTNKDKLLLIVVVLMDVVTFIGMVSKNIHFAFYPQITKLSFDAGEMITYGAFLILAFTPGIIEIKENLKWKYYNLKM